MVRKEEEKISKIIGEMTRYLLVHQVFNFEIAIDHHEASIDITFSIDNLNENILSDMKNRLKYGRDEEVETYGWTLMGNTELEISPRLLDEVIYSKKGDKDLIKLIRKH